MEYLCVMRVPVCKFSIYMVLSLHSVVNLRQPSSGKIVYKCEMHSREWDCSRIEHFIRPRKLGAHESIARQTPI